MRKSFAARAKHLIENKYSNHKNSTIEADSLNDELTALKVEQEQYKKENGIGQEGNQFELGGPTNPTDDYVGASAGFSAGAPRTRVPVEADYENTAFKDDLFAQSLLSQIGEIELPSAPAPLPAFNDQGLGHAFSNSGTTINGRTRIDVSGGYDQQNKVMQRMAEANKDLNLEFYNDGKLAYTPTNGFKYGGSTNEYIEGGDSGEEFNQSSIGGMFGISSDLLTKYAKEIGAKLKKDDPKEEGNRFRDWLGKNKDTMFNVASGASVLASNISNLKGVEDPKRIEPARYTPSQHPRFFDSLPIQKGIQQNFSTTAYNLGENITDADTYMQALNKAGYNASLALTDVDAKEQMQNMAVQQEVDRNVIASQVYNTDEYNQSFKDQALRQDNVDAIKRGYVSALGSNASGMFKIWQMQN